MNRVGSALNADDDPDEPIGRDEPIDVVVTSTDIVIARPLVTDRGPTNASEMPLRTSVLLAALVLLGALFAFGWYAGTRASRERVAANIEASTVAPDEIIDRFDAVPGPIVGADGFWSSLGPVIDIRDGSAHMPLAPVGETAIALHDPGWANGTVGMTIGRAAPGTGMVFRFEDLFNHWTLIAAPEFGTWNLVLTVDGTPVETRSVGLSSTEPGTRVAIALNGPAIGVFVDGEPALEVLDPTFDRATSFGVIGTAGSGGSIDDVFAIRDPNGELDG